MTMKNTIAGGVNVDESANSVISAMTKMTIDLWNKVRDGQRLPAKFTMFNS